MNKKTKFLILVPAYNCAKKIDKTIRSVATQTYENWVMIIVDDVSSDNTASAARRSANKWNVDGKVSVLVRTEKHGEVRNTLDICTHLDDDTVVVRLDAGDWITDMGCFEMLDIVYQQHNPAVLWTNQRWAWSGYTICGPIDKNVSVYDQPWKSSHLKTFRAREIKGLNEKNFKDDDGNWIQIACDQAVFLPMMERARRKGRDLAYLPIVMYHYDIDLGNPELFTEKRSQNQKMSAGRIRERGYIE